MKQPGRSSHSTSREGVLAGAAGATGVAAWFFVVDLLTSQLLYTPRALGEAVARIVGLRPPGSTVAVGAYTVLHYAAFAVLGVIAAAIVHRSRTQPAIFAAALLVFAVVQTGFYLFMFALHAADLFGPYGWWLITGANIFGLSLIGILLWRWHPGMGRVIDRGLTGSR